MKPIKSSDVIKQFRPAFSCPLVDLRALNLVHAAPIENDHAFLTLRFDPKINALVPRENRLH